MDINLFDYDLAKELIAQHPSLKRDESKLMFMGRESGEIKHLMFKDIGGHFNAGDVLVVNDTRVFPARIEGQKKSTGGGVRFLVTKKINSHEWEAIIEKGHNIREGEEIDFCGGKFRGRLTGRGEKGTGRILFSTNGTDPLQYFEEYGVMPLPPYIKRSGNDGNSGNILSDSKRYQTVYAEHTGSIAAPTAGLHFTETLLTELEKTGVKIVKITLHVGTGTFKPLLCDNIDEHVMDEEEYSITEAAAGELNTALSEGKRIIAVGTTTTRALESEMLDSGKFTTGNKSTGIFIKPGFAFKAISGIITNFHLPRTTLLALVSAFCGRERILSAYEVAKQNGYRFYSYGDAMFIV